MCYVAQDGLELPTFLLLPNSWYHRSAPLSWRQHFKILRKPGALALEAKSSVFDACAELGLNEDLVCILCSCHRAVLHSGEQ